MISAVAKRWSIYKDLNLPKSFAFSRLSPNRNFLPIRVYKKVFSLLGKGVSIEGNGRLCIGIKPATYCFLTSIFSLCDKSKLILNGHFQIFTGCRVIVNPDAVLELGNGFINQLPYSM